MASQTCDAIHGNLRRGQTIKAIIITGTRAPDLSPVVYTHLQLVKAGVPGDLIVGEGIGHCYVMQSNFPEAQDAYAAIEKFFQRNLH